MTKEQSSVSEALKAAKKIRLAGPITNYASSLKEVQNTYWEISEKFRDFDDILASYVQRSAARWISISDTLKKLAPKELSLLKGIQPRPDYLAHYKLLTLKNKMPGAGDPFVNLISHEGAVFVWSPKKPEKFKLWRETLGPEREFKMIDDLTQLYVCGQIEDLDRFDPNKFIDAANAKLGKTKL